MNLNANNFIKFLNKNYLFESNPSIAVGVSGGPDSMGLLFLLKKWSKITNAKLTALIVNHNLREDSKDEVNLVKKYLINKKINTKILSVKKNQINKRNMNEARINRFNLMTNYCNKKKILHLFLAHHKDDNLETFLNRKVFGSDFDGLQSIKFCSLRNNIVIIRPLLNFSKKEILEYNKKNKVNFIVDPSNINLDYTRPAIRKFINQANQKIKNEIKNEFEEIKRNSYFYDKMLSEILIKNTLKLNKNSVKIHLSNFLKLNVLISEKIVKNLYKFLCINRVSLRSNKIQLFINEARKKNFKVFNLGGMLIRKSNNSLNFSKKPS